jgi:hypothetical protein
MAIQEQTLPTHAEDIMLILKMRHPNFLLRVRKLHQTSHTVNRKARRSCSRLVVHLQVSF